MKIKRLGIVAIIMMMSFVCCACGKTNQEVKEDTVNTNNVVDGKMYITEEMKTELDNFVGTIDVLEEKSKAEISILTKARTETVSAALEIKWTTCNITVLEKKDDYQYQFTAKVLGSDATGEDVEIEFVGYYHFEEDENKTEGYQLIETYTDLSEKIWQIKGWVD